MNKTQQDIRERIEKLKAIFEEMGLEKRPVLKIGYQTAFDHIVRTLGSNGSLKQLTNALYFAQVIVNQLSENQADIAKALEIIEKLTIVYDYKKISGKFPNLNNEFETIIKICADLSREVNLPQGRNLEKIQQLNLDYENAVSVASNKFVIDETKAKLDDINHCIAKKDFDGAARYSRDLIKYLDSEEFSSKLKGLPLDLRINIRFIINTTVKPQARIPIIRNQIPENLHKIDGYFNDLERMSVSLLSDDDDIEIIHDHTVEFESTLSLLKERILALSKAVNILKNEIPPDNKKLEGILEKLEEYSLLNENIKRDLGAKSAIHDELDLLGQNINGLLMSVEHQVGGPHAEAFNVVNQFVNEIRQVLSNNRLSNDEIKKTLAVVISTFRINTVDSDFAFNQKYALIYSKEINLLIENNFKTIAMLLGDHEPEIKLLVLSNLNEIRQSLSKKSDLISPVLARKSDILTGSDNDHESSESSSESLKEKDESFQPIFQNAIDETKKLIEAAKLDFLRLKKAVGQLEKSKDKPTVLKQIFNFISMLDKKMNILIDRNNDNNAVISQYLLSGSHSEAAVKLYEELLKINRDLSELYTETVPDFLNNFKHTLPYTKHEADNIIAKILGGNMAMSDGNFNLNFNKVINYIDRLISSDKRVDINDIEKYKDATEQLMEKLSGTQYTELLSIQIEELDSILLDNRLAESYDLLEDVSDLVDDIQESTKKMPVDDIKKMLKKLNQQMSLNKTLLSATSSQEQRSHKVLEVLNLRMRQDSEKLIKLLDPKLQSLKQGSKRGSRSISSSPTPSPVQSPRSSAVIDENRADKTNKGWIRVNSPQAKRASQASSTSTTTPPVIDKDNTHSRK